MASQRDIKRRISSVQNTRKVTKAMEMVSAARLRRAQQRIEATRPYALRMVEFLGGLAETVDPDIYARFPLLDTRPEVRRAAVVAMTADRGLAGGFNASIIRATNVRLQAYAAQGVEVDLLVVGKRGVGTFRFQGKTMVHTYQGITDRPTFLDAQGIAHTLADLFVSGRADRVDIIFNHFKSAMEQRVDQQQILPVDPKAMTSGQEPVHSAWSQNFIFEPSAQEILRNLLPSYMEIAVYRALLESTASEHGARMTAMRNASETAGEMIDSLTLAMNRARQASITQEILEVVAGAEALS
jgi:F-type H+-transporting ATPase subunit gamma